MPADDPAARLLHGLDARQREAVTSAAAPLAIIAAAGSGKTTVLTRRIAYRVTSGTAHSKHVLALTFTRDAAAEMKRRLRTLQLREPIEAGTFHSVALRLLRDRAFTRNEAPPRVAQDRLRLVRECLTELQLRAEPYAVMADLDWARARLIEPARFEQAARTERRRPSMPAARFGDIAAAYERLKRRRGVVDFDDLLERSVAAVRSDATFADLVHWRFRHLFVDEAQDLNPLQHLVLEAWRGGRADICLVGDPRQAIYGWNGADHTTLTEVERRYPGVTVVSLTANYRCTPQVVRAGAAALLAGGQTDDTQSQRADGPAVVLQAYADEQQEAQGVARQVRALLNHHRGGELAVLARTNEQLTALQQALTLAGVPTERSAGRSPLAVVLAEAYAAQRREELATWADTSFAGQDPLRRRVAEEVDRYLVSNEPGGLRAWVEAHSPFDDLDQPMAADAVALLTFHAAKGREWWGVFVTGAEQGLVPHASALTPAALAEEARLLYVALTRAAHHLVITHSDRRNSSPAARSPWLDGVAASTTVDQPAAPPAPRTRRADDLAPWREWRAGIARVAGVAETAVCTDRVLRGLHDDPPADVSELAARLGMSESAAARLRPLPSPARGS